MYESGTHVLNGSDFVSSEVKLSFVEWVSELGWLLDQLGSDFHEGSLLIIIKLNR